MKILSLDIETSPNLVYAWGLFDQNIGLNQIKEVGGVLCFAAKFLDEKKVHFHAVWDKGGREEMVAAAHRLLSEADVVMHYNGRRFDIPHLNREFVLAGLTPPEPFADIDLLTVARGRFKFTSNKLEHVATQLGLEGKVSHEGFSLWTKVMGGDEVAQRRMRKYNIRDVTLLEDLYAVLQPWIRNHPSRPLYDGHGSCPACASVKVQRRGFAYTKVSKFQQYQCQACGHWFRGAKRISSPATRAVA